jgi:O-acetyl-ADP-ribose deacetylase (regulator of RNase III)
MISISISDITRFGGDAIVNSANTSLLAGSGISGAIHQAAGPELEKACRLLGQCPVGEARLTPGFALPARYVIHAVGPRWWDGSRSEHQLLVNTYQAIFELVRIHALKSVAIPAISTRVHRFPIAEATAIAVDQARLAASWLPVTTDITFCSLDQATADAYLRCGVPAHPIVHSA